MKKLTVLMLMLACVIFSVPAMASDAPNGAKLFKGKCKMCHAMDRKKMGPAVMKMNKDAEVLRVTITDGRKSMPKFGKKLGAEKINALVDYIQSAQAAKNPCAK
ncbi:MAG: cytochrome c [Mariprofundaceae bacterium]